MDILGYQYKVKKGDKVFVGRINQQENTDISFDKVMLSDNGGKVLVGAPFVDGVKVEAKILSHVKGDKVIVFKKKRRKGYQKSNGHRQLFTQIEVKDILV
ncbi:50S ribosomal protein L21 [Ichthyobacterium seriolicida]|uniref:Large ribosomal subunit protein bL21 n=1 Tax=Ichthyobacterium seriolicida TaxID=242600 RepID=A0A1J1DYT0_9FLAO|nr:50S ribosomal protein L21 [Ichthyobacterium seriolicida]